jgi:hypothetical protein
MCVDCACGANSGCACKGAAECVCRKAKAQGVGLRERGFHRVATVRLRLGGMALASHYGINL